MPILVNFEHDVLAGQQEWTASRPPPTFLPSPEICHLTEHPLQGTERISQTLYLRGAGNVQKVPTSRPPPTTTAFRKEEFLRPQRCRRRFLTKKSSAREMWEGLVGGGGRTRQNGLTYHPQGFGDCCTAFRRKKTKQLDKPFLETDKTVSWEWHAFHFHISFSKKSGTKEKSS